MINVYWKNIDKSLTLVEKNFLTVEMANAYADGYARRLNIQRANLIVKII